MRTENFRPHLTEGSLTCGARTHSMGPMAIESACPSTLSVRQQPFVMLNLSVLLLLYFHLPRIFRFVSAVKI